MIASSSLRKEELGDVLLVNEGFPERCWGVCGETGRAIWLFRRPEVADVRLLAPIEVSLAIVKLGCLALLSESNKISQVGMGIPGLINAIGPGERISLAKLAVTHLERTARPIRIAVDISIWLFQVQAGRGGRNPELRTLFYRLLKLLALPVHPLFVYDGQDKPAFKRGKAVSTRSYGNAPIIKRSKDLIERFRFPWHEAPGEAEAECARLQQAGIVDAVMSNDVDALMFGSSFTIMNFSKESGSGSSSATHVTCYTMGQDGHSSNIPLDRPGMILFAMLSGGDYLPSGVPKCGSKLAAEIAKAGFGEDLLQELASQADVDVGLNEWRERLQYELEENESGYFTRKHPAVRVPASFPDRKILEYYAQPKVSSDEEMTILRSRLAQAWDNDIDPLAIRTFAADHFEWNYRSGARKLIRLLAEPLVSYRLRLQRPVLGVSPGFSFVPDCPPSLQKVYRCRSSFGTDAVPELQLDMLPADVVGLDLLAEEPNPPAPSQSSVQEGEEEEDQEIATGSPPPTPSKSRVTKRFDPFSLEKVWVFETVAKLGIPGVVKNWEKEQAEKAAKAEAAAAKKNTSIRRTGPKKKGPIDAGMKRGSILKYGTLTKEKSELSTTKQAHLLEAATSTHNPLPRLVAGSESSSPITLDLEDDHFSSPSMYLHQRSPLTMHYDSRDVDGLLDTFSSMCTLSPSVNIKRHPMSERTRLISRRTALGTGHVDIEESDSLGMNDDYSPPQPARHMGLKISYSVSDVCEPETFLEDFPARALTALPSPSRKTVAKSKRIPKVQCEEKAQVEHIEKAIEILSLSSKSDEGQHGNTAARSLCQISTKKAPQAPKIRTRSSKDEDPKPARSCSEGNPKPEVHTLPLHSKNCESKQTNDANKSPKKSSKEKTITILKHKTTGHLENVILHDGFWSIDQSPPQQDSCEGPTADDLSTARRQNQTAKKKRISRVSILDLVD
ncbi:DNA repair protein (XPGC) [Penicillium griseofulvum]|uniref:DNA repair protein (XPGC) n=1 Tax=Penicillium patulum TaxID=5078 RepID=A0A135LC25_PENPA|nr:DNA repair protein (XPGC) [Penicillium griseofulvum]KXG46517.1 DNA repair protein (XPGC) [Penicillium griseofulvum]